MSTLLNVVDLPADMIQSDGVVWTIISVRVQYEYRF